MYYSYTVTAALQRQALLERDRSSTVNEQASTCAVLCHVTGKEDDGLGNVVRLTQASDWDTARHVGTLLGVGEVVLVDVGLDSAGEDRVAANLHGPERNSTALHQALDTSLGWGVVRLLSATHERRDTRDCNDRATLRRLSCHLVGNSLNNKEGAIQVDVLDAAPQVVG